MQFPWTAVPGTDKAYTRPLGRLETGFAWDSLAGGVADSALHLITEIDSTPTNNLFSQENVRNAWCGLKRLFPLLGATLSERADGSGFDFIVNEDRLKVVGPQDIIFFRAKTDEEAYTIVGKSINAEPILSKDQLAQLWLIAVPRNKEQTGFSTAWHLVLHVRHFISDGTALFIQCMIFIKILCLKRIPETYIPRCTFLEHLSLHPAVDDLNPARKCVPRLRWRRAIASVIASKRNKDFRGGYTLPHTNTIHTPQTPVRSLALKRTFSTEVTNRILSTCRNRGTTLGAVMPVLSQVAHARISHRLYIERIISQTEWKHRITEPMHFLGPMNLRPFLDQDWIARGGLSRGLLAIALYPTTLPPIPLANQSSSWDKSAGSVLPYHTLFSRRQFFLRCQLAKRQAEKVLKHPFVVEFAEILREAAVERSKAVALRWRTLENRDPERSDDDEIAGPPEPTAPCIISNSCSTIGLKGNSKTFYDQILSLLDRDMPVPHLRVTRGLCLLRSRPRHLYLTAATWNNELELLLFADATTYDESLVKEWFGYLEGAMLWYLEGDKDGVKL